jgi:hypothetical protein
VPFPILSLSDRSTTIDGVRISFQSIFPFVGTAWVFCYSGPRVRHYVEFLGLRIWLRDHPLSPEDSASVDLIEDAWYRIYRPRWYELNLWSCALRKDRCVMRSNDLDDLGRSVDLLNRTIKEVCERAAS